jgi:hypothetical protein
MPHRSQRSASTTCTDSERIDFIETPSSFGSSVTLSVRLRTHPVLHSETSTHLS